MRLRQMLPSLLLTFALSLVIFVFAAARQSNVTAALAALLFALQVLVTLLRLNTPLWRVGGGAQSTAWAWDNSLLTGIAYAWGAAAMFTAYSLGGLVWRHWWQYGGGLLLLAVATLACAGYLVGPRGASERALRTLMRVTLLQVAAVAGALVYLVASGKLATVKDDWAANQVFIAGGVTVLIISLVSLRTWRRLGTAEPDLT